MPTLPHRVFKRTGSKCGRTWRGDVGIAPCGVKIDHYELLLEESKLCCIHLLLNC